MKMGTLSPSENHEKGFPMSSLFAPHPIGTYAFQARAGSQGRVLSNSRVGVSHMWLFLALDRVPDFLSRGRYKKQTIRACIVRFAKCDHVANFSFTEFERV